MAMITQKIVQALRFSLKECVFLCIPVVSSPTMTTNTKLALYSTFLGHIAQRCEC